MQLRELTRYLDEYLDIGAVPDYPSAHNGLQIECECDIRTAAFAVDACAATIRDAVADGAQMLIVHHGLFWGATAPITDVYYRRISSAIRAGLAVYSCHLPLDAHPEVGNCAVLARRLGLTAQARFAEHDGFAIGVVCSANCPFTDLADSLDAALSVQSLRIASGPEQCRRVGVLTGGGGSYIRAAHDAGCDTLVTGEGAHHTYFDAEELAVNVLYAGHYATEKVGIEALADHVRDRLGLRCLVLDHPTGL